MIIKKQGVRDFFEKELQLILEVQAQKVNGESPIRAGKSNRPRVLPLPPKPQILPSLKEEMNNTNVSTEQLLANIIKRSSHQPHGNNKSSLDRTVDSRTSLKPNLVSSKGRILQQTALKSLGV